MLLVVTFAINKTTVLPLTNNKGSIRASLLTLPMPLAILVKALEHMVRSDDAAIAALRYDEVSLAKDALLDATVPVSAADVAVVQSLLLTGVAVLAPLQVMDYFLRGVNLDLAFSQSVLEVEWTLLAPHINDLCVDLVSWWLGVKNVLKLFRCLVLWFGQAPEI